ncbi:hypothetical protein BDS110ZK25_66960 [Bradyrhizobium diazoefficiens]|uniref:Uncharacterized protein n=1 Tax=Bradyrhizobium diazoefficiens TaxID=1355477 RepID=A0A809ZUA8_9BRAD|nr:hypothetical protein BJ6T_77850 [Bradyrhizobium japonicum USDA 6]BBZ92499.1 hypothetical protein F07S3_23320 [Bradyrhizobium diazoefficiens]GEC49382.1 hypothetical protein BJA01nite_70240 [Bradyrhizobium japonicum]BCA01623.1 hypothetical protein H12S4_25270 [Bradyrhizobium diazoefficiens]BCA10249.1 hypothetical protein BDHF08_20960 [Bradyrhizobium diazoefficiens]
MAIAELVGTVDPKSSLQMALKPITWHRVILGSDIYDEVASNTQTLRTVPHHLEANVIGMCSGMVDRFRWTTGR